MILLQGLYLSLVCGIYGTFLWQRDSLDRIIVATLLVAITLASWYRAKYTLPVILRGGTIVEDSSGICRTCHVRKIPRSKHCSTCNHCVDVFDHHCVWLNVCIGGANKGHFIVHLACTTVLSAYGWWVFSGYSSAYWVICAITLLATIIVGCFFVWNMWMTFVRDETTNEWVKRLRREGGDYK